MLCVRSISSAASITYKRRYARSVMINGFTHIYMSILNSGEVAFEPRSRIIRESTKFWFSFNAIKIKINSLNSA